MLLSIILLLHSENVFNELYLSFFSLYSLWRTEPIHK